MTATKTAKPTAKKSNAKANKKAVKKNNTKAPAKVAAKPANLVVTREVIVKEIQNGQTKPKAGTTCAQVWALADAHNGERAQVLKAGLDLAINKHTVTTQLARWRTFHGIVGRVAKQVEAVATA